jgi:hypothetical protein
MRFVPVSTAGLRVVVRVEELAVVVDAAAELELVLLVSRFEAQAVLPERAHRVAAELLLDVVEAFLDRLLGRGLRRGLRVLGRRPRAESNEGGGDENVARARVVHGGSSGERVGGAER